MPLWLVWTVLSLKNTHTAEVPEVGYDGITEIAPNVM